MTSNKSLEEVFKYRKVLTLGFVEKGDEILLGWKKRGFGKGLWNGFGGKVEAGESIMDGAIREIKEECGLDVFDMEKCGVIHFLFEGDPIVLEVHVFRTSHFTGQVVESEEMMPRWWHKDQFPFDLMWPDDSIWNPLFLKRKSFKGIFLFKGHTEILGYLINNLEDESILLEENCLELVKIWPLVVQLPVLKRHPLQDNKTLQTMRPELSAKLNLFFISTC